MTAGSHRVEYGYRSERGDHEIWAESERELARTMLGSRVAWDNEGKRCGGPLQILAGNTALEACAEYVDLGPIPRLPKVIDVRVAFGQWKPRTPDEHVYYKLVVRETFRSEHG